MGLDRERKEQSEMLHPVMLLPVTELSFKINYSFESQQASVFYATQGKLSPSAQPGRLLVLQEVQRRKGQHLRQLK